MFETPTQIAGAILTALVTAAVLIWGGRPERIATLASLTAYLVSPLAQALGGGQWPLWGVAVVDVALLAVLVGLLLRHDRVWLIVACGVVLITLAAHLGLMFDPRLVARGYVVSLWLLYFVFLGALAFGPIEIRMRGKARSAG